MSDDDSSGAPSRPSGPLLGSIVTIIIVMTVLTTTLTYSAPLALESTTSASSSASSASTSNLSTLAWAPSVNYPTSVWTSSCVESNSYIYCVGGDSGAATVNALDSVYYAQLSASGVGQWTTTTSYPTSIRGESCVASASVIYCVGGYNSSLLSNGVYYASLSSSGVGNWRTTTAYPLGIWTHSCAASSAGIYCVGGGDSAGQGVAAVYYAPFSASGVGSWTSTSSYPAPVKQESCLTTTTDLYCFGGYLSTAVYYAPLTSSGVGAWTNTTGYPFTVGANLLSCVPVGTTVYCVGGHTGPIISNAVYDASLSSSGVGRWIADSNYPTTVWGESCVASQSAIFCVGGETTSTSLTGAVSFSPAS